MILFLSNYRQADCHGPTRIQRQTESNDQNPRCFCELLRQDKIDACARLVERQIGDSVQRLNLKTAIEPQRAQREELEGHHVRHGTSSRRRFTLMVRSSDCSLALSLCSLRSLWLIQLRFLGSIEYRVSVAAEGNEADQLPGNTALLRLLTSAARCDLEQDRKSTRLNSSH